MQRIHTFVYISLQFSAVCIGLVVKKKAVIGVVYNPFADSLYKAYKGGGSFLNGTQIHVSNTETIANALIQTNVGYERGEEKVKFMMGNLTRLMLKQVRSIRMGGSAALELCRVAEGKAVSSNSI